MSKLVGAALVMAMVVSPAMGAFYVAGDFNGWNAAGDLMTDGGGGIYSLGLTLGSSEFHEYKVTDGTWGDAWPESGNSWFYTDGSGNITLTYDTNTYADGWVGATERLGVDNEPGAWTAVGDWQGWDNANAGTAMSSQGGGIYVYETTLAPGNYSYKAVWTGSWNAIGQDARSINADNIPFEVTVAQPVARMYVDALTGTAKVETAVPEPTTIGLGLLGVLALVRRRR